MRERWALLLPHTVEGTVVKAPLTGLFPQPALRDLAIQARIPRPDMLVVHRDDQDISQLFGFFEQKHMPAVDEIETPVREHDLFSLFFQGCPYFFEAFDGVYFINRCIQGP